MAASPQQASATGLAVVVDARGGDVFAELSDALARLRADGVDVRTLVLEANDEVLVRRFESSRRPHPLQGVRADPGRPGPGRELIAQFRRTRIWSSTPPA